MIERGGRSREIGAALQAQARQMFHWWHRVRDGTLAHRTFASYMWPVRQEVERLLDAGQTCGVPKTEGTCRELFKLRRALWTFVRHEGVEPTNNAAERAIRPGVLWRKGSSGTQRAEGSRFVETMMTVVATLKQQHRHVLDYVTAACEAALWGSQLHPYFPSLPTSNRACVLPHSSVPQVNAYQRQSTPPRPSNTSCSVGLGWRASRSEATMSMPGVQMPHCAAPCARNACCRSLS